MDENKYNNIGETGDLGAAGKGPDGELFYPDIASSHQGPASYEVIASNFELVHPTNHGAAEYLGNSDFSTYNVADQDEPIMATVVEAPRHVVMPPQRPPSRLTPLVLFCLTCFTTLAAGTAYAGNSLVTLKAIGFLFVNGRLPHGTTLATIADGLFIGFQYAGPLMLILLCHEMGHYIQACRNRIPASLPYFIPIPFGFLGTMGAVIGMRANLGDRRSLFDIGISGPLAGLVPTLIFLFVGLHFSEVAIVQPGQLRFGTPLLMQWIIDFKFGAIAAGYDVQLHPMAFAAWVGLLITSLNLIPIGQLDGGHILHALMPRSSAFVARTLLFSAVFASYYFGYPAWALMIVLLFLMGPKHPPTADDRTPIGPFRVVLGWLTLAFILIGFTPMPIQF